MSKLQQAFGCGTCASIIPARGNADPTTARRHEEEQLEKRIEEETGEVKKRKCNPIEYLLLFGKIPELEQVQVMTMGDLTAEDARQLLDAGCSKRHLLRLYGANTVGGPHYRQLEDLLGGQVKGERENITEGIAWIEPAHPARIRISKYGAVSISSTAVGIAPAPHHEGCRVKIGVDGAQKELIVMPNNNGPFNLKRRGKTLSTASIAVTRALQAAGISIPATFEASWDKDIQAWIGRLTKEAI